LINMFKPYVQYINDVFVTGTNVSIHGDLSMNEPVSVIQIYVNYTTKYSNVTVLPYPLSPNINNIIIEPSADLRTQNVILSHRVAQLLEDNDKLYINYIIYQNQIRTNTQTINELEQIVNHTDMWLKYERNQQIICSNLSDLHQCQTQKNFRKMYSNMNSTYECPVCYSDIIPDQLFMPICGHSICVNCSILCKSKCPICRDPYHGIDKLVQSNI
jgi:hypothetical protein